MMILKKTGASVEMTYACAVSMTGDPITVGHRDIIARAAKIFSKVYVFISKTSSKAGCILNYDEKVKTITADLTGDGIKNFEIVPIEGALVDQVGKMGIYTIVRGLRNEQDLVYETDMSSVNRMLNPNVETIYLPCKPELSYVSSSMVRELMRLGKFAEAKRFTSPNTVAVMKKRLVKVVAITGGIAAGKSEVQNIFEKNGWNTIDCDDINRLFVLSNDKHVASINRIALDKYGVDICQKSGTVDKHKLADLIFSNPDAKRDIQNVIFPVISEVIKEFTENPAMLSHSKKFAVQVPLLFEPETESFTKLFEKTICITAPDAIRISRMKDKRGYSDEEITRRMSSQMPQDKKASMCDYVISNNGTVADLTTATVNVINELNRQMN